MTLKDDLENQGLYRSLFSLPQTGGKFSIEGKILLNFSSNDYLNLLNNNEIKNASKYAIDIYGTGSGGSRLMSGTLTIHEELEEKIANWLGYEAAIIFGSGFLTNIGVISSLAHKNDYIFFDKLNHASLIDGILLSEAKWKRFKHNDLSNLKDLLENHKNSNGRKFIIVDSIFSMDGDIAHLNKIYKMAEEYSAFLIVDEAHSIGIFGDNGTGCCNCNNIKPNIITGTFSKSLGSYGGFAACSKNIKDLLVNKARSFIYSTSLPPSCLGAASKAIDLVKKDKKLGDNLIKNAKHFYGILKSYGFKLLPFESQIIPIIIGDNKKTVQLSNVLSENGIYVKAIRPPTVPKNTARLRLSVTLAHTIEDLEYAAKIIYNTSKKLEVI